MYKVVEFADNGDGAGGGISVVRLEWLTPREHHCLWPPHRIMSRFNKCLIEGAMPDDTWEIYSIKRTFYETDSLTKAREKAKQAEIDSEVGSYYNQIPVQRRKKTRKIYDSDTDTSEGKSDDTAIICPWNKWPKDWVKKTIMLFPINQSLLKCEGIIKKIPFNNNCTLGTSPCDYCFVIYSGDIVIVKSIQEISESECDLENEKEMKMKVRLYKVSDTNRRNINMSYTENACFCLTLVTKMVLLFVYLLLV